MRAFVAAVWTATVIPAAAAGHLEEFDAQAYEASGTADEVFAKAEACLGAAVTETDAAARKVKAKVQAPFMSLLVQYEARSTLEVAAEEGRFRMRHSGVEWRERASSTGRERPFSKVPTGFGSGAGAVRKALLAESEKTARCLREGKPAPSQETAAPPAAAQPTAAPTQSAFDTLKSLAGSWRGKDEAGHAFEAVFELAARSDLGARKATAVVEKTAGYLAVYHLDGDSILVTLYAEENNQPRLRAKAGSLDFALVDVGNLRPGDGHMTGLTLTLEGADRLVQRWTWKSQDGAARALTFTLTRSR